MKKVYCNFQLCLGCKSCEVACAIEHSKSKDVYKAVSEDGVHRRVRVGKSTYTPFPIRCQHCEDAPCVTACISGALRKDEKGRTIHDAEKCVGCWMCIMACPFGALTKDDRTKTVFKCDLCPDRDTPACVEACPTKALFFGTVPEFEKMASGRKKEGEKIEIRHHRK